MIQEMIQQTLLAHTVFSRDAYLPAFAQRSFYAGQLQHLSSFGLVSILGLLLWMDRTGIFVFKASAN